MAKKLRKQIKLLRSRQERFEKTKGRKGAGYKMPGSMNSHKK